MSLHQACFQAHDRVAWDRLGQEEIKHVLQVRYVSRTSTMSSSSRCLCADGSGAFIREASPVRRREAGVVKSSYDDRTCQ